MECKYHTILENLHRAIWERIEHQYDSIYFSYWLGDESNIRFIYKEIFEEVLESQLTESQNNLLEKKASNLESIIHKWCDKWKLNNPELQNEKLPKLCLKNKIYEYIIYQLNKSEMVEIIREYC